MRVAVIADEITSIGYKLIGIRDVFVVRSKWDAVKTIRALREMPNVGIILVGESISEYVKDEIEEWKKEVKKIYPIVLSIPDIKSINEKIEDPIRNLVKRAIGVDILERGEKEWKEK